MGYLNGVVTAPVSMGDISSALHYSSLDLGTLYSNGVIKVNSMYKPMRGVRLFGSSSNGDLTDAERREYDWGWGGMTSEDGLYNALSRKVNGEGKWNVLIQQGSNSGYKYRMLDMNNYNENADIPFKLTLANATDGEIINTQPIRMIMTDFYTEIQPYIHQWGCMPNDLVRTRIGLGFYLDYDGNISADSYAYMLSAATNTLHTFDTIGENDEIKDFAIPSAFLRTRLYNGYTTGLFHIIPFIIPDTIGLNVQSDGAVRLGDFTGRVFTFHQDPLPVRLKAQVNPIDLVNFDGVISKNVTFSGYRAYVNSLVVRISNSGTSSQSVRVTAIPDSAYMVANTMSGSFATKTITLAAGASQDVQLVTSTPSWETYNQSTVVDITITVGSTSKVVDNVFIYSIKEDE